MKFFVAHYTPLVERKQHIIQNLKDAGIDDYEFIETKDRETLTEKELSKFCNITPAEISLFLKHIEVFKEDDGKDTIVAFEDDAILCTNFLKKLDDCLSQLQETQWDVLFSGECSNLHCDVKPGELIKRTDMSRGACMYVLNVGVGKQIYELFNKQEKITVPIDWWLNSVPTTSGLRFFWSEPTLVSQGSTTGLFKSALR
jgi:glycosyl transferase family 25